MSFYVQPWASVPLIQLGPLSFGLSFGVRKSMSGVAGLSACRCFGEEIDPSLFEFDDSGVKSNVALPVYLQPPVSESDRIRDLYNITRGTIESAPELYRSNYLDRFMREAQARDFNYWKENYPTVKLRTQDNPKVDPRDLRTPWKGKPNPPLVQVQVTPRRKPPPDEGFFTSIGGWLSPVLAVAFPGVGTVLGAAIALAQAGEAKSFAGKWKVSQSAFEPQYDPVPFLAPVPLDRAQLILTMPWYAPAVILDFVDSVNKGDFNRMMQVFDNLRGIDPVNSNLLPEGVTASDMPQVRYDKTIESLKDQEAVARIQQTAGSSNGGNWVPLAALGILTLIALRK